MNPIKILIIVFIAGLASLSPEWISQLGLNLGHNALQNAQQQHGSFTQATSFIDWMPGISFQRIEEEKYCLESRNLHRCEDSSGNFFTGREYYCNQSAMCELDLIGGDGPSERPLFIQRILRFVLVVPIAFIVIYLLQSRLRRRTSTVNK